MSEHRASISWKKESQNFDYKSYNREHLWDLGHNNFVKASAATQFLGKAEFVDPETAFTACLSSCHMLTFLAICSRKKIVVESYNDHALGFLEKNKEGKLVMGRVELNPQIVFSGEKIPSEIEIQELHQHAHQECFIANSVTTKVLINSPTFS